MKARILISAMIFLLLNGCTLPVGLEIASWIKTIGDVGSYVATEKSLTDHVVSNYNDEDCAFHRWFLGDDICKPNVQIAEIDDSKIKPNNKDVKIQALFPPKEPKIKAATPADTPSVIVDLSVLDDLPPKPSVTINWDVLDNLKRK